MANNTRKNTKSSSSGKGGAKRKTGGAKASHANKSGIAREAIVLIVLALSIIFFISNFSFGGKFGAAISSFFFGLFGLVAYIFPILLFLGTLFIISNRNNSVARVKIIASVAFVLFLCVFIQLISGNHADEWKISQYYTEASVHKNGGGFFGGILCRLFVTWFGKWGAGIFDGVLMIICGVIITERSFLGGLRRSGKKVYDTARNDMEQYREDAKVRKADREQRRLTRAEKKTYGVTFDTEITKQEEEKTGRSRKKAAKDEPFEFHGAEPEPLEADKEQELPFYDIGEMAGVRQDMEPVNFDGIFGGREEAVQEENSQEGTPLGDESFSDSGLDMELIREEYEREKNGKNQDSISDMPEHSDIKTEIKAEETIHKPAVKKTKKYVFPPLKLLKRNTEGTQGADKNQLRNTAVKLQQTLASFGVKATVTSYSCGPSVTRYELQPEIGVRVSKIVSLADDIKLNLAAADIRIEAPIPGKSAVGIEVPNTSRNSVLLGDLIASSEFKNEKSLTSFTIGKDVAGKNIMADIATMPHVLVAGTTGSGKSVCLNSIILSILYKAKPDEVKFILVDPKMVEFKAYNGIPHLLTPVVTDPKKAAAALNWAVVEMDRRYEIFSEVGAKDIESYNEKIDSLSDDTENKPEKLFKIIIIMDELADLMMTSGKEAEAAIVRLAQKARACGIHLVLATQKPTVDVVTGLIKSNVPSRIALTVASQMDSRVMLDENGADKLLGRGDMLYLPSGKPKPERLQGPFVTEAEIDAVVNFIKDNNADAVADENRAEELKNPVFEQSQSFGSEATDRDAFFVEAGKLIIEKERASIGMLQRVYRIGFNRAARIMDQLCDAGVVGPEEGTKPRKVLMTQQEFDNYLSQNN